MNKSNHLYAKHFRLHQLTESTFAAIAEDGGSAICNAGIIDLGGQVVVFDTFLTPQAAMDLRQATEELFGRKPHFVVNSHYHNDHIWGNQVFVPGSQIISSVRTRELITTAGMEEYQWYSANSGQQLESLQSQYQKTTDEQQRNPLAMWIGYYEGLLEAIPHLSVSMPSITFENRLEIHGSKQPAELITFEGAHTQSDTVLHLPEEGVVFMGDLLFVGCHPYLADGDPLHLLKALEELSQIGATCLVPGHGPAGTIADLRLLIEYATHCLDTAQLLVNEGSSHDDKIKELKVAERFAHWKLPQFYQANIRCLCQRLNTISGDKTDHSIKGNASPLPARG
jgi:glyoxylase-like metal-dependent hydrolase (beta-lactamase superfamily II)